MAGVARLEAVVENLFSQERPPHLARLKHLGGSVSEIVLGPADDGDISERGHAGRVKSKGAGDILTRPSGQDDVFGRSRLADA